MLYARKTRNRLRDSAAGLGCGTRPRDWKTDELESMKSLSLRVCLSVCVGIPSLLYVTQPIVADQHECQAGACSD